MVIEDLQIFRSLASELGGDPMGKLRKVAARAVFSSMQTSVATQRPAPSRGEAPVGSVSAEHFAHHRGRIRQGPLPVADERRAVHCCQDLRLQLCEPRQRGAGASGIWQIAGYRAFTVVDQRLAEATDDVVAGDRLDVSVLMKQIRAKQHALRFLEQQARVPAMRNLRRVEEAKSMTTGGENLAVGHRPGRAQRDEVVHPDAFADDATERRGCGCELLPFGEPAALDRKSTRLNSSHANISYAV